MYAVWSLDPLGDDGLVQYVSLLVEGRTNSKGWKDWHDDKR